MPLWDALGSVWGRLPLAARRRALFATNDHFLVGVVGIVRDPQGRVLLLDHRFRTPHRWGLPGGFINHRESFARALARELSEEVGLSVEVGRVVDTEYNVAGRYLSVGLMATAMRPEQLRLGENPEIQGPCPRATAVRIFGF